MAGITNIGGAADEFHRYKRPTLIAKVEGKGNGIKTRIVNLTQIGRSLHRRPAYITKFFGCELGAQTNIDDVNSVYIVNGAHTTNDLEDILKKFEQMFVMCANCGLPETDLKARKNGDIQQKCNACGSTSLCDATHKLCTFIKNNPPNGKGGKSGKLSKEERRRKKGRKPSLKERSEAEKDPQSKETVSNGHNGTAGMDDSTIGGGGGETFGVDQGPVMMLPGDGLGDLDGMMIGGGDFGVEITEGKDNEVQWSVDTSKEAQEARKKEIGDAAKILERVTISEGDGESDDKVKKLRAYMDDGKRPSKVLSKAEKVFGTDLVVAGVMNAAILDESVAGIPSAVKEKAVNVLKEVVNLGKSLGEWLDSACASNDKVVKVTPHILKTFFDEDAISEEEIMAWFNADGNKKAREVSKDFVAWLQESEDEGSGDEESEDEGEGE